MKRLSSYLSAVILLFCLVMSSCKDSSNFTVKGVVSGGKGQTLYIENVGLSAVSILDSIKLNSSGEFKFKIPKPEYPDFYRLKLDNQLINFAIDSTETLSFVADAGTFATSYTVEGSENSKAIKSITLAQLDANLEINKLRKGYDANTIADSVFRSKALEIEENYKKEALKYIYAAPMSTAAYFALFQQVDGMLFFDLYDKDDSKAFSAVATGYNINHKDSPRTKQLYNLALQSIKVIRSQRPIDFNDINVKEVNVIDIELPNIKGEKVKLMDLVEGNHPVIVSFTTYQAEWSPALNIALGDLYEAHKSKGLKIYQISLDADSHFWKNSASNVPWTCVRDPQSVYSSIAALYNVKQLPATFIIDRKGNLVKRIEDLKTLETEVKKVL